jgi:ribosomal protein L10
MIEIESPFHRKISVISGSLDADEQEEIAKLFQSAKDLRTSKLSLPTRLSLKLLSTLGSSSSKKFLESNSQTVFRILTPTL